MQQDSASLWESIQATDEQRHRINETLRDGERLLWLGRPKPKGLATWGFLACNIAFLCLWEGGLYWQFCDINLQRAPWFIPLILAAFILLPLAGLAVLLPWLCAARCTVYAVTNRRAIALTRGLFRYRLKAWKVQDYIFIDRGKNGTGDIIYECRANADENFYRNGLINLPDVETVAALIQSQAQDNEAKSALSSPLTTIPESTPDAGILWESIHATEAERHRIDETLGSGEHLLWLGRPKRNLPETLGILAMMIAAFCIWGVPVWSFVRNIELQETSRLLLLFQSAFFLLLLACPAVPLLWLCARHHTVYAVTNRRAIALTRILFRYWLNAWNVQDYLFIKRGKNGSGDIIYEQERYGASAYLEGLRGLADVDAVAALIEKAGGSECTKVEKAHEHAA